MSTLSYAVSDSVTMLRRDLRHALRNPNTLVGALVVPILLMLIFVYIFGGAFNVGTRYIDYVVPGIIMMTATYGVSMTAVNVANDMSEGVINRFRTMAISRTSVLTGHVAGSVLRTMLCIGLVLGVALVMGFRPIADFVGWIATIGVIALLVLAITWLSVAFGLAAKTVEAASFATFPLVLLPFVSSAYAPPNTMPSGVRWFTDNQPFTPVIETLRALLTGTPIGNNAIIGVAWCVGLALVGYFWAKKLYNRDPAR